MIDLRLIAGVVVLYHPDDKVLKNILSYVGQIDFLYIVDNSESKNDKIINALDVYTNFKYIWNRTNLGIAKALNIGAMNAIQDQYSYLLMMDQDSLPSPTMVQDLINPEYRIDISQTGIISPFISIAIDKEPPKTKTFEQVLTAWTSGSLLNLSVYKQIGPFLDDLFIDFVDHEYCLRLAKAGFKTYKIYTAFLKHEIGKDLQKNRFLWHDFITSNHSALRRYYITRNRLYISKLYKKDFPRFFWIDKRKMAGEFISIILFEEQKLLKFKMIIKGFLDYKGTKLGEFKL